MLELSNGDTREGEWRADRLEGFVFYRSFQAATGNGTTGNSTVLNKIERWEKGRRVPDGAKERDRQQKTDKKSDEETTASSSRLVKKVNFDDATRAADS